MNADRDAIPAIIIAGQESDLPLWREVWLGIEEEGIPWRWRGEVVDDADRCAWLAAGRSPLLVGIACNASQLVVHYRHLPASAPLFTLMRNEDSNARRLTGSNAARLVKGLPFRQPHC